MKCEHCGTVDEVGPHTPQNCRGVMQFKLQEVLRAQKELVAAGEMIERSLRKYLMGLAEIADVHGILPPSLCEDDASETEGHLSRWLAAIRIAREGAG